MGYPVGNLIFSTQPQRAGAIMSQGCILTKEANRKVAEAFLKYQAELNPSCFGYATVSDGKMLVGSVVKPIDFEKDIKGSLEVAPELEMIAHFGGGEIKTAEDAQPFIVLKDDKDSPSLAIFMEGAFDDSHDTNSRTDESNFIKGYLQEKIDELYDLCDNDLDKLTTALQKPTIAREILASFGHRGTITFLASTGVSFSIEKGDKRKKFAWG